MRFKRLEMQGFKSFVDRTAIEFDDGLTSVVGPNGCGKSNVVDAVRWVLGEQAPRSLRAKRMEDVIFNGSADRKPLGMAEVSLTISDLNGIVTHPVYKDYSEIIVTRRLYRSGESEYLINRNACRLKDITDLFLDTGVSLDSFSIVEQGRIESLVNARPLDRRVFIEEAAGIMKYKARRNEALRKLELAQANLLRVADIMREKESRLRSLRRQARKATFFKEYRQEVKDLDLRITALDFLKLTAELGPAEREYDRLKEREEALLAAVASREAERESVRAEVTQRSEALGETRRRAVEIEGYLQRLENRLEMFNGRLVELDAEDARRAEEMETLAQEAGVLREERDRLAALEASLSAQASEAQRAFDLRAAELAGVRAELGEVEAAAQEARRLEAREADALSEARQRMASAASRREGIAKALERAEEERAEAGRLRGEARAEADAAARRWEEIASGEARLKEEAGRAGAERERLEGLLREMESALASARESVVESRSSLQAIEEIGRSPAGGRVGPEAFRACGAEVMGALADLVHPAPGYERALEAAFGERLMGSVVADPEAALEAVRALVASGGGRGLALPLVPRAAGARELPRVDGVIGPAADLVRCDAACRPLVESLLAGIGVARDLETARGAWRQAPGLAWVTPSGEMLLPSGAVEGGAPEAEAGGVLERGLRVEELRADVNAGEARLDDLERACAQRREALAGVSGEAEAAAARAREAELARVEAEGALRAACERAEEAEGRHGALLAERDRILAERDRLEAEHRAAEEEGRRADAARREAEARSGAAAEELRRVGARASEMEAEVTERRVALTEVMGRAAGARAELHRIVDAIGQNAARQARREEEKAESVTKRERLHLNLGQSRDEIANFKRERAAVEAEQTERVAALREAQERDEELGSQLRRMRAEAGGVQAQVAEAAERRTTLRVQRESMIDSAREDFGLELPEVAESHRVELPAYQEHITRLEMLRTRLDRMGEVNPLAAQEYDEINQEYAFLKEQQEDLERSIADLHATIDKLNQTTKRRFLEAFEQVNRHFAEIFSRLFQGGEARMFLLDPDDPLETGVDIEVRPPGKRPSNIMLLSAGEKALTAISLLFSIFSVRPSPFCLLDEVDATLDDANVGRFREVLSELEDRSQFIIITHNKRTMSYASQLYGVTQREKGVSEVVSVKLNRRGDVVSGDGTLPVGTAAPGDSG